VAPWQSVPVDREHYFSDYARTLYPPAVAAEVAPALEALAKSQQSFTAALGSQTMHRFWDDPLEPARLKRLQAHQEELHLGRLQAEEAAEHLYRALALKGDPATLSSLLLGARMLDYMGIKNIYAVEIAGFFDRLGSNPRRDLANLLLRTEVAAQDHGFLADLMDTLTELREAYRNAWLAEYTPYRLESALQRWDAEYQYWRALQDRFQNFRLEEGGALPPLDSFRPRK
jgi:hexosaminidase